MKKLNRTPSRTTSKAGPPQARQTSPIPVRENPFPDLETEVAKTVAMLDLMVTSLEREVRQQGGNHCEERTMGLASLAGEQSEALHLAFDRAFEAYWAERKMVDDARLTENLVPVKATPN